jgi:hypothetical protein
MDLTYLSEHGPKRRSTIEPTACEFCGKMHTSKLSLNNHRCRCPQNPDRKIQIQSEDGKLRSREANEAKNKRIWADTGFRQRHRDSMQRAVRDNPDSYTTANRGRVREIIWEGQRFQGSWELEFYLWARSQGLAPLRPEQGFPYEWQGSRLYFPDFWIPELGIHVEVKGYETDRDREKWRQFPGPLCVIRRQEISAIKAGQFRGVDSPGVLWYNKTMGL